MSKRFIDLQNKRIRLDMITSYIVKPKDKELKIFILGDSIPYEIRFKSEDEFSIAVLLLEDRLKTLD